jgi:hypothetical protein
MAIIQKKAVRKISEQERKANEAILARLENAKHSRVYELPMNRDLMNHYQGVLTAGFEWLTDSEIRLDFDNSRVVIKVPVGKLFLKDSSLIHGLTKQLLRAVTISKNEVVFRGDLRGVILGMIDQLHVEKLADDRKQARDSDNENENIRL